MNGLIKGRSVFNSPLAIYTLAAAFIFTLAFFIHFGKEARASKSWKYVMYDCDAMVYWSFAKGRMMTPRCDGNPYYYEDQGTRHRIPHTTLEAVGFLSKYTRIPFTWFFPAWYLLAPLFVWLVIVICLWRLWNYSLGISAASAMLILLSTLFFFNLEFLLFRFSRPLDGVAPLFLWLSLIFKGDPGNKKHVIAVILTSALALWLMPFYAVFCLWFTALEYLYSLFRKEAFSKIRLSLFAVGSCFISGLIYGGYAYYGKNIRAMNFGSTYLIPFPDCLMTVVVFAAVAAIVLFFCIRLKQKVTLLDRLVLGCASWGILVYFTARIIPAIQQIQYHMFYFSPIMIFPLVGWVWEKLCVLKEAGYFSRFSKIFLIGVAAFFVFSFMAKKNPFFVLSGRSELNWHYFDYLPKYFFAILFLLWLVARFDTLRRWVTRRRNICTIIVLLVCVGAWINQINKDNRDFPFDGAYQWLKQHAQKNDVVLTVSERQRYVEYLFLETGLKSYFCGAAGPPTTPAEKYRKSFLRGLQLGVLDKIPYYGHWSLDQKLRALKLDYILVTKPSPYFDVIEAQLEGYLQIVYQDKQCLLWKVS